MKNCDANIESLKKFNKEKDAEIERKQKQLKILQDKRQRIEQQKAAVDQYQIFLEEVRNQNQDDYSEVNEIRDRHKTLDAAKQSLEFKKEKLNSDYESKKLEVN